MLGRVLERLKNTPPQGPVVRAENVLNLIKLFNILNRMKIHPLTEIFLRFVGALLNGPTGPIDTLNPFVAKKHRNLVAPILTNVLLDGGHSLPGGLQILGLSFPETPIEDLPNRLQTGQEGLPLRAVVREKIIQATLRFFNRFVDLLREFCQIEKFPHTLVREDHLIKEETTKVGLDFLTPLQEEAEKRQGLSSTPSGAKDCLRVPTEGVNVREPLKSPGIQPGQDIRWWKKVSRGKQVRLFFSFQTIPLLLGGLGRGGTNPSRNQAQENETNRETTSGPGDSTSLGRW